LNAEHYDLPWPPSVNTYWRSVVIKRAVRVLISQAGRNYRKAAIEAIGRREAPPLSSRLSVRINAMPPDRRKRDLDNIPKAVLDALTHAGVWEDDSQIDQLLVTRGDVTKGGEIRVSIIELEEKTDE